MKSEYEEQLERVNQRYQELYKLLDDQLSKQIDPHIQSYDRDIHILRKTYAMNIHRIENIKDRSSLLETLYKEENLRYLKMLKDCSPFVQEADKKLKALNEKLQMVQKIIGEQSMKEQKDAK